LSFYHSCSLFLPAIPDTCYLHIFFPAVLIPLWRTRHVRFPSFFFLHPPFPWLGFFKILSSDDACHIQRFQPLNFPSTPRSLRLTLFFGLNDGVRPIVLPFPLAIPSLVRTFQGANMPLNWTHSNAPVSRVPFLAFRRLLQTPPPNNGSEILFLLFCFFSPPFRPFLFFPGACPSGNAVKTFKGFFFSESPLPPSQYSLLFCSPLFSVVFLRLILPCAPD